MIKLNVNFTEEEFTLIKEYAELFFDVTPEETVKILCLDNIEKEEKEEIEEYFDDSQKEIIKAYAHDYNITFSEAVKMLTVETIEKEESFIKEEEKYIKKTC